MSSSTSWSLRRGEGPGFGGWYLWPFPEDRSAWSAYFRESVMPERGYPFDPASREYHAAFVERPEEDIVKAFQEGNEAYARAYARRKGATTRMPSSRPAVTAGWVRRATQRISPTASRRSPRTSMDGATTRSAAGPSAPVVPSCSPSWESSSRSATPMRRRCPMAFLICRTLSPANIMDRAQTASIVALRSVPRLHAAGHPVALGMLIRRGKYQSQVAKASI